MTDGVLDLLEKASQSIGAAEALLREGYSDFSASRAYYAMFYAVEALHLSRGQSFSKHSAVIAAFGKEFVKTGVIDSRFHRSLLHAFDLRNAGDYGTMHTITSETARQIIEEARGLVGEIRSYLDTDAR